MDVKPGYCLKSDQRSDPVVWRHCSGQESLAILSADAILAMLREYMGIGRGRRLTTWGRSTDDPDGPHWIGVRSGTTLHTDPRYLRYTHQLIVLNQGWGLSGITMELAAEPYEVGDLFCCDTHSPHILIRDARRPFGRDDLYYLAASMDSDQPMNFEDVARPLIRFVSSWRDRL